MRNADRQLSLQYAVTEALASSTTLAEASRHSLAELGHALGWKVGGLWLVDHGASVLRCYDMWRASGDTGSAFEESSRRTALPPGIGLPGRVWSRREAIWVPDVLADPSFVRARWAAKDGLRAAFAVPVQSGGRILGVLEFFDGGVRPADGELLRTFSAIGSQVGQAVERIQSQDLLRASEARLRGMMDGALDAVITIDSDSRIVEWNRQAENLFGWSGDEVVGRTLTATIIPEAERERHRAGLVRFLRTGEGAYLNRRIETTALHRTGRTLAVELAITPVRIGDDHLFSAFVRDIGERKRTEERLRFLAEAGAVLAASLDYETTLARVAQLALTSLADYAVVHVAGEGGTLRRVAIAARDPEFDRRWAAARVPAELDGPSDHPALEVLRTGRPIVYQEVGERELARLARSPEHLDFLRGLGLRQWMVVPLVAHGETIGTMGFGVATPERRWSPADLGFAEDLARRGALAVENARLYRQAEEAVRTRDDFLSTVSHDLRNPLASIKGLAQLLRRRAARFATTETLTFLEPLERIDGAATRMTTLLNELVEVSGLRIGQPLELTRSPVDLVTLAREVVKVFAQHERHTIEIVAEPPAIVAIADAGRVERILTNLVTNAVKYSPAGGRITVSLSVDDGEAVVSVRDEGIGIPARDLPHIFERYRRGSNVSEATPGTGIGLTAAKQLVELHGGTLAVESLEGEGSTFTLRLPLETESDPEKAETSSEVEA